MFYYPKDCVRWIHLAQTAKCNVILYNFIERL